MSKISKCFIYAGMPKRPIGFPTPNFVQGQVSASTPGTPVGGPGQQLQSSQAMAHTGKMSTTLHTCGIYVLGATQLSAFLIHGRLLYSYLFSFGR